MPLDFEIELVIAELTTVSGTRVYVPLVEPSVTWVGRSADPRSGTIARVPEGSSREVQWLPYAALPEVERLPAPLPEE